MKFRSKALSAAVMVASIGLGAGYSNQANACTCIITASTEAATTTSLIGTGAAMLSSQMYLGFEQVAGTVTAATGKQTKSLVTGIELMTKTLASELRKIPVAEQEMDRRLDQMDPARQASDACTYTDRSGDLSSSQALTALQSEQLDSSSASYNEMTSSYPDGVDKGGRFKVQTHQLLKNRPDVEEAGMKMLGSSDQLGALSPSEVQEAATFINLTTNPNPPAKMQNVTNQAAINNNVEADLYNMRMSLPQSVQNQILSYEAPIMDADSGSWLADTLQNMSPDAEEMLNNAPNGVSYSDLLKVLATHRLKDPLWLAKLANKDQSGALKDLALTKADSMLMDYELWKQEKNTALLMSQLLAAQNRQKRGDQ